LVPGIAACVFYPDIPIQLMGTRLANSFLSSSLLREDSLQVAEECIKYLKGLDKVLNRVGITNIEKALQDGDAVGALGRIRQAIMPY
jgi:hypothetical protein